MNTAIQHPTLAEGERYLGAFGDTAGNIHHTILLPGDNAWVQTFSYGGQSDYRKDDHYRARAVRRLPI